MRRSVWPVVAVGVVLALGGCSEDPDLCGEEPQPPPSAGRQLPVRISPPSQAPGLDGKELAAALPPEKPSPTLMDKAMREVMSDTLNTAGVVGDVRPGGCGKAVVEENGGTAYPCTVFYEGLQAVWKVQFSDVDASGGWTTAHIRTWPVKTVLAAGTVHAAYGWLHLDEKQVAPRCDRMPKLFVAEAGKPTGYECQTLGYACRGGAWHQHWDDVPVYLNPDTGRVDFGDPDGA